MKFKLKEDEEIIYSPKLCVWDRSWFLIITTMFLTVTISGLFLVNPAAWISPVVVLWGINILTGKVIVTNKRIIFQNLVFLTQSISLKNIITLQIETNPAFLFNSGIVSAKIVSKVFPTRIYVPDRGEFCETVIKFIIDTLPENSLDKNFVSNNYS